MIDSQPILTSSQSPRILIVSNVVPAEGRGGGCMALFRHFVLRKDFAVLVCGPQLEKATQVETFPARFGWPLCRLRRTRFHRFFYNLSSWLQWHWLPLDLVKCAQAWKPDLIFNVADCDTSGWAWQLSRRLGIPLAVNFQDLFPLFSGLYPVLQSYHLNKFRFLNRHAEVVFYTSPGMKDWLGSSPNGHVLYPMGASIQEAVHGPHPAPRRRPWRLIYAGNCYGPYGRMMLRLARQLASSPDIHLSIFTMGNDWPEEDVRHFRQNGVMQGERSVEELRREFSTADAFLTVMSFEDQWQVFNQTSFTTKWLDYAPYGKPVFVWAPETSSIAQFARAHNCACVIATDSPLDVQQRLLETASNPSEWERLGQASLALSQTVFNPDHIHALLKTELNRLCA
jgi:hypothetical protein